MELTRPVAPNPYELLPAVPSFTLSSDEIADGKPPPEPQTADGGSHSPSLRWSGFPEETKSFMISCYDPDAPGPAGWWHWTIVNIPANVTSLAAGAGEPYTSKLPAGAFHLMNDSGTRGYAGSAPPPGDHVHRYFFAVHALNIADLEISHETLPGAAGCAVTFNTIGRALLVPTAQR